MNIDMNSAMNEVIDMPTRPVQAPRENTVPQLYARAKDIVLAVSLVLVAVLGASLVLSLVAFLLLWVFLGGDENPDAAKQAIQLTTLFCGGGTFILLIVGGMVAGMLFAQKQIAKTANYADEQRDAAQTRSIETLTTTVNNVLDRMQAQQEAVINLVGGMALGTAPRKALSARQEPMESTLISTGKGQMKRVDRRPLPSKMVQFEMTGGHTERENLFLVDAFFREMSPKPDQTKWEHRTEEYGKIANFILRMAGTPLMEAPRGGYEWRNGYEGAWRWWENATWDIRYPNEQPAQIEAPDD